MRGKDYKLLDGKRVKETIGPKKRAHLGDSGQFGRPSPLGRGAIDDHWEIGSGQGVKQIRGLAGERGCAW